MDGVTLEWCGRDNCFVLHAHVVFADPVGCIGGYFTDPDRDPDTQSRSRLHRRTAGGGFTLNG